MDKELYVLCSEYVQTMDLIYTLLKVDMENHTRLRLFRLSQERLTLLEKEMFDNLVENEFKK